MGLSISGGVSLPGQLSFYVPQPPPPPPTPGELWTWGTNYKGNNAQGDSGQPTHRSSPSQVGSDTDWIDHIARNCTLALKSDGSLWSWGSGSYGMHGLGNTTDKSSPSQVGSLTDWTYIATGSYHSAAIKTDGTLWTFGFNRDGALGLGDAGAGTYRSSPVQVGNLTDWSTVTTSNNSTLALKTNGTLWSWGSNNRGQLGAGAAGNNQERSSPVQIGSLTDWASINAGNLHTIAIKTDGTLWAWGYRNDGGLGDGQSNTGFVNSPIQIGGLSDWSVVAAGGNNSSAIKTDGTLWTWGRNIFGELGLGNTTSRSSPSQVGSLTNWSKIENAGRAMVGTKTDGTIWSWGYNGFAGALGLGFSGIGSKVLSPTQIGSLTTWINAGARDSSSGGIKTVT